MSTRTATLAVEVVDDVARAVSGLGDVEAAAGDAGSGVARMGTDAQDAARKLNITADSADELGGKAGKATGALGALSSGFELVGAGQYATALQGAALATDFMSGVGDSLNLVMESTYVKTIAAKVAMVGHAIASGASAAATGVMTGAQWALNAAMSANPIALIVIALIALVAGLVIAWQKSETFRNIVTGAFDAVKNAASNAFNWVKQNWPLLLAIITGPIGLAVLAVVRNWDDIKTKVSDVKKWIGDRMAEVPGLLVGVAKDIKDTLLAPFEKVGEAVQNIIDLVKKIKLPKISLPGLRVAGGGSDVADVIQITQAATTPVQVTGGPTYNYTFNVTGILDADDAAATIQQILDDHNRLVGAA